LKNSKFNPFSRRFQVINLCQRYKVSAAFLFGSSVEPWEEANDIDIAVKGLEPGLFFKFYAELIKYLEKNVDLVDLSKRTLFNELVEENGIKIYG
jgi:predicted nucleotidyltransferase